MKLKRLVSLLAILALMLGGLSITAQAEAVELVIPHYKSGENVGAKLFLPQVEAFNEKYEGQYKIVIEELTQDLYAEKMKQLGAQNKLPALVEGGDRDWLEQVVIPNDMFVDLMPYVEADPDLKAMLLPAHVDFNTTEDGKLLTILLPIVRPMGMFYNSDMLPLEKEPGQMADWDEFFATFAEGDKMAFMTGENAWTTALVLSSLIAKEEGGPEMLQAGLEEKVYDYTGPIWVNAVTRLQAILQTYAASNTVGAVYADAANAFMSRNAVAIANGPWMTGDFAEGADDKWSNGFSGEQVKSAVFPGNVALANTNGYGWWIPSSATEAEREAAIAFLTYLCSPEEVERAILMEGGSSPTLNPSDEFLAAMASDRLLLEYVNAITDETLIVAHFADIVPSSVAEPEFGKLLPKLIDGSMTAEEFCAELTVKAAETRME